MIVEPLAFGAAMLVRVIGVERWVLRPIELLALSALSPFRPRCRRSYDEYQDADTGVTTTIESVVVSGRGKVVARRVDSAGYQHCAVVWGFLRYLPTSVLMHLFEQETELDHVKRLRSYVVYGYLPCTHVHLLDWSPLAVGETIDLRGAKVVSKSRDGKTVLHGATDLDCWIHHDCAWIMRGRLG